MIRTTCPNCAREHEFSDMLAGMTLICKGCANRLKVPSQSDAVPASTTERTSMTPPPAPPPPPQPAPLPIPKTEPQAAPLSDVSPANQGERILLPQPTIPKPGPLPAKSLSPEQPAWWRHLHWLLILALIPLAWTLLQPEVEREAIEKRIKDTMDQATPEEREHAIDVVKEAEQEGRGSDPELLFEALPNQKLAGALLPRKTWLHWGLAAGSAVLFLGFLLLLAKYGTAEPRHILYVGLFTATCGVVLLLLFQVAAEWSQSINLVGRSIVVLLFYIVKFIGYSYRAALDPDNGFLLSFVGYTLGVGFCEEVAKSLPLLWLYNRTNEQTWRGAFVWGLASGAGFGIAEGIMYSGNYYNGISGPITYLVRFISCVALHAVWTGSVGITLNRNQEMYQDSDSWYARLWEIFRIVAVPMVLHGLYDTLLKKELNALALAVALTSFGYLAYLISREQGRDAVMVR